VNPSIEQLLRVQEVDSEMIFIRESLRRRPMELDDDRRKLENARKYLESSQAQIKRFKMDADRGELEVKRLDAEIEKLNVALNQAKSNQEYTVFKEQIRRQGEARGTAEEQVLEKLSEIDALEVERKERTEEVKREEASFRNKEAEMKQVLDGLETQLGKLEERRAGLIEGIDREHLKIYDRVLARHNNFAIARVEGHVCQGCYMTVTSQEINLLLQGQFLQCKSCSRLFYLE